MSRDNKANQPYAPAHDDNDSVRSWDMISSNHQWHSSIRGPHPDHPDFAPWNYDQEHRKAARHLFGPDCDHPDFPAWTLEQERRNAASRPSNPPSSTFNPAAPVFTPTRPTQPTPDTTGGPDLMGSSGRPVGWSGAAMRTEFYGVPFQSNVYASAFSLHASSAQDAAPAAALPLEELIKTLLNPPRGHHDGPGQRAIGLPWLMRVMPQGNMIFSTGLQRMILDPNSELARSGLAMGMPKWYMDFLLGVHVKPIVVVQEKMLKEAREGLWY